MADLDTAIQRYEEALERTPADHPEWAGRFGTLGGGYHTRYQATGVIADLDTTIQRYQEALNHSPSLVNYRLTLDRNLLELLANIEN
jgi:hypothetical protein